MTLRSLAVKLLLFAALALGSAACVHQSATKREAQAEAQYPPLGQFIDVDGVKIQALVQGSGPDLVLIHGASGNLRDFSFDLMPLLTNHYRVIAFDRPGLGWSDSIGDAGLSPIAQADVLRAAAAKIGVKNPIVLGQSYGGAVALA